MGGPLEGIKVIDLTFWQQGPVASLMLGDMGADIIKIENPKTGGDPGRGILATIGVEIDQPGTGLNYFFEAYNRNKRSLSADLSQEQGKEIIYRLIKNSDVFVTNFMPNTLKKLKMDYETLSQYNPGLIYGLATGYGLKGPDKDRPSFDIIAQARSGVMSTIGDPDGPPHFGGMGIGAADQIGGIMLAYGIVTALLARERKGFGQMVSASLIGSIPALQSVLLYSYLFTGQVPKKLKRSRNPLANTYQTKDGEYICLSMFQTDPFWPELCKAVGTEGLENDPRFNTHERRTAENGPELTGILDVIFATEDAETWLKRLDGHDLIYTVLHDFSDMVKDPQFLENEYIVDFDHPSAGRVKIQGIPIQFSKTPGEIKSMAPEFGQHTEEVLLEIGYNWEEITELKNGQVIP